MEELRDGVIGFAAWGRRAWERAVSLVRQGALVPLRDDRDGKDRDIVQG